MATQTPPDAERIEQDDIPIDVTVDEDTVTVETGSYGNHPGVRLEAHLDYVAELIDEDIEMEVQTLLDVAMDRAIERVEEAQDKPSFDDYDFDEGDHAIVDWSEGKGSEEQVTGRIEDIHKSGGDVVVTVVSYDDPNWPNGRGFDAAPEWIETL